MTGPFGDRARHRVARSTSWRLLIALVMVATSVTLPGPLASVARAASGTVAKNTTLREEPYNSAPIVLILRKGTELAIDGKAEDGYYPASYAGLAGWVETGSVASKVGGSGGKKKRTATEERIAADDEVNLRATADDNAAVLLVIAKGEAVEPTGDYQDGFVEVDVNGSNGWVRGEYLTVRVIAANESQNPREMSQAEIIQVIYDAADYYNQPRQDMLRVARCESDLVPRAINQKGKSYGIFQFKTLTWLSTPYADNDIFDPRASAYAAGWMWSVGRRNEWVCQ